MTRIPTIETERLILRGPAIADTEAYIAFMASEQARYWGGKNSRELAWRSFAAQIGHWHLRGFGMFVIEERATGIACGMTGPWEPLGWPEPELGWALWSANAEGRGIATEAALAARHYIYDTLKWPTLVSYIESGNTKSMALAERLGAVVEAGAPYPGGVPSHVYRHPAPGALA